MVVAPKRFFLDDGALVYYSVLRFTIIHKINGYNKCGTYTHAHYCICTSHTNIRLKHQQIWTTRNSSAISCEVSSPIGIGCYVYSMYAMWPNSYKFAIQGISKRFSRTWPKNSHETLLNSKCNDVNGKEKTKSMWQGRTHAISLISSGRFFFVAFGISNSAAQVLLNPFGTPCIFKHFIGVYEREFGVELRCVPNNINHRWYSFFNFIFYCLLEKKMLVIWWR